MSIRLVVLIAALYLVGITSHGGAGIEPVTDEDPWKLTHSGMEGLREILLEPLRLNQLTHPPRHLLEGPPLDQELGIDWSDIGNIHYGEVYQPLWEMPGLAVRPDETVDVGSLYIDVEIHAAPAGTGTDTGYYGYVNLRLTQQVSLQRERPDAAERAAASLPVSDTYRLEATTWQAGTAFMGSGQATDQIRTIVAELLDHFQYDYLKANPDIKPVSDSDGTPPDTAPGEAGEGES